MASKLSGCESTKCMYIWCVCKEFVKLVHFSIHTHTHTQFIALFFLPPRPTPVRHPVTQLNLITGVWLILYWEVYLQSPQHSNSSNNNSSSSSINHSNNHRNLITTSSSSNSSCSSATLSLLYHLTS